MNTIRYAFVFFETPTFFLRTVSRLSKTALLKWDTYDLEISICSIRSTANKLINVQI